MSIRMLTVAMLALTVPVSMTALAAADTKPITHDGKLVSVTGNKLVMTNNEGQEHSQMLTADAKITNDGKVCKVQDLKSGTQIRVTTRSNDAMAVTSIEAIDKNKSFSSTRDGNFVSIKGNIMAMTGRHDKDEQFCTLTDDVLVTCDGKVCKAMDLKPGMKVRVTSASDEELSKVIRVEAIARNLKFAKR